jgi:hypothetical protein
MTASKQGTPAKAPEPPDGTGSITQEEIEGLLEEESPEEDGLTLDEVFDILRNQRRRDVLLYLAGAEDNATTLSELAEHVAAKENDIDTEELSSSQRKRVYIGLYQCHLPKMDDIGVVDYDQDRGTVVLQNASKLLSYLPETEEEPEDPPVALYTAVLVVPLVAVGLIGPGPVAAVPTAAWTVLSTGALLALALYTADL